LGLVLLAPVFGEHSFRLFPQPPSLVELALDPVAALVERGENHPMRPDIAHEGDEDEKRGRDPELGFEHGYSLSASSTAVLTAAADGAVPIRRSTIAAAASPAIARTLAIAEDFVAAIARSAPASLAFSSDSSALRRSSASALSRWLVSSAIRCARPRASASAFS